MNRTVSQGDWAHVGEREAGVQHRQRLHHQVTRSRFRDATDRRAQEDSALAPSEKESGTERATA
jgi:hypothetical protein